MKILATKAGVISTALALSALVAAVALACGNREPGSNVDPAPTATVVPSAGSPTAGPGSPEASPTGQSGTASPSPDPSVDDEPAVLPELGTPLAAETAGSIPVSRLAVPGCQAIPPSEAGSENSTAPFPTSTPLPPEDQAREDLEASLIWPALRDMSLIAGSLDAWSTSFDERWLEAGTAEEQAALLQELGARVQRLCTAASLVDAPFEVSSLAESIRRLLLERHAWALDAARDLIIGKEPGATATQERWEQASANMQGFMSSLHAAVAQFPVTVREVREAATPITQQGGGVEFEAPGGWLLAENGLRMTAVAPPGFQQAGLEGLGPAQWGSGTAVRIHRLRNPDGLTGSAVLDWAAGLLSGFGAETDRQSLTVDGDAGTQLTLVQPDTGWQTIVALVDDGQMTLFVEFGCPAVVSEECREVFNDVTAGLNIRD